LIDARGHGESEKSHDAQEYGMDGLAADVVAVLDRLGIEQAHFFGFSRGTVIGCAVAQHAPHRLWSLLFSGMNVYGRAGADSRERARKLVGAGIIITPEYNARRLVLDPEALIAGAVSPNLVDILTNLKLPCLVYMGEGDPYYQSVAEFVAQIPGARFFSLPGVGHGQSLRYSHQVLPQIKQFLQEVTPRAEQNRAMGRKVIRTFNLADYGGLEQYYQADWTWDGKTNQQGAEGVRQLIGQIFSIFADAEAEIEEIVTDDETVTKHWVFKGTHTGAWRGGAPTGTRVRVNGATTDRIVDGKIVESHLRFDPNDLQRQLGLPAKNSV
jgi:predicted ester cyclase